MQSMTQLLRDLDILEPIPTHLSPRYSRDNSIKAVLLDIYGTLLISESGDIDESKITTENLKRAFEAAHIPLNTENGQHEHQILRHLLRSFTLSIQQYHKTMRENNVPFPEVDIIRIWEDVVSCAMRQRLIKKDGREHIKCLTFVFEVLSNRVYPMPGMKEIIAKFNNNNTVLGIVSNAQFYTPIIMNYFLYQSNGADYIKGIDPALQVFSYKEGVAKPEIRLYQKVQRALLEKHGIQPDECLFVGNDMYKDIYPAHKAGMKTALFAGDERSLRLRKEKPEIRNLEPDFVITKLDQLIEVIP